MVIAIGFHSCKSSKKTTESSDNDIPAITLNDIASSYSDWESYSTSGKLSLSGAASFSTSMQIKMVHHKCISISIRPVLGIEVAKVFVNNDSAVIIDKMNKVYSSIDLSNLKNILPADISSIQDIILARPFLLKEGTLSVDNVKKFNISSSNDGYIITPRKKENSFSYLFGVNQNKQIESLSVFPTNSNKTYTAEYSDFVSENPGSEASKIKFDTSIQNLDISLSLYLNPSKTKWNSDIEESLSIGKSYKKVSILEHFELLKTMM